MSQSKLRALVARLRRRAMFSRTKAERAYWRRALVRNRAKLGADRLSSAGAAFIAEFEGFRSRPYRDAVGVWTIGYGSTKGVGPNSPPVTKTAALARLKREANETYGAAVRAAAKDAGVTLDQREFDALTSAVYNLGPGVLAEGRSLGQALRARNWRTAVAGALLLYDKAGGRALPGLTRRREAERRLFLGGGYR